MTFWTANCPQHSHQWKTAFQTQNAATTCGELGNAWQWRSHSGWVYTAHLVICTPTCTSEQHNYGMSLGPEAAPLLTADWHAPLRPVQPRQPGREMDVNSCYYLSHTACSKTSLSFSLKHTHTHTDPSKNTHILWSAKKNGGREKEQGTWKHQTILWNAKQRESFSRQCDLMRIPCLESELK